MELLFDIIADFVLSLLGKMTRHSKNGKTQTVVDILVATTCILVTDGLAIWGAVSCYRQENVVGTVAFASVVVISLLLIGFVILRRLLRRKAENQA